MTNNFQCALDVLNIVLKENESFIEGYLLRAKINWFFCNMDIAHSDWWKCEELNPNHLEVQEFLKYIQPLIENNIKECKLFIVQGELDRAMQHINKGLTLNYKNTDLLIMKAYIHRSQGRFEQSLKDLDQTLKIMKNPKPDEQLKLKKQISLTYNEMGMFLFKKQRF